MIFKTLAKNIKGYTLSTILTPLFIAGEVILEVFIPTMMANMIDDGIYKGAMNVTLKYSLILVIMCICSLICGAVAGITAADASAGFAKNLREKMFHNVQNYSFANIDKYSTGSLVTRMTTDVTNVQNSFQMIIRIAVRCPLMLIIALVMSINLNAKLSLIFLVVIPFIGLALGFIIVKALPTFKKLFTLYDNLNNVVRENLHGIRVVKAFVREDHEYKEKFKKASGDIHDTAVFAQKLMALNQPAMMLSVYACILLISWFGGKMIIDETGFQVGDLTAMISYVTQILMSCMMLSMILVMITQSAASAKRVVEVIDEESTIKNPENDAVTEIGDGSICFKNASFGYGGNAKCIKNVSAFIPSGSTVGIVGSTGSAKSTFVQLIPRLYDVTEGSVEVGGVDVKKYNLKTLRDGVAMVLQTNTLFSGTIIDNLKWGNENATQEQMETACKQACADSFIKEFPDGYNTYIEQGGSNVSGGQKQRLCIARALLKNPKILILDDSTSAVDMATDAKIREVFKTEIPNITKLIIAQRISSVMYSDMIIVLDNGEISACGTHEELLKTCEIYKEVYQSQMKGGDDNA